MTTSPMNRVIQHLRRAVSAPDAAEMTDAHLLSCFIERRDQAAFEALVRRHGPMVLGVCRRVLGNFHDAEDAFQATFLVLVRKAASIVPRGMVGNWLYGVANQTARKARERVGKRRSRERQVMELPEPKAAQEECGRDLQALLDQELARLPDKYRVAVVLCDLEGKTYKEAARLLGWPEGTFSVRLARARNMLAQRLARRGWALSAGSLGVLVSEHAASACMPAALVAATVQAAAAASAGQAAAAGVISTQVAVLTEGVLKAMLWNKLKTLTGAVLLLGAVVLGGGFLREHSAAAQSGKSPTENVPAPSYVGQPSNLHWERRLPPVAREVSEYNALFDKALKVVADYFTVEYANRFEGRIDTVPALLKPPVDKEGRPLPAGPLIRRRARVNIRPSDKGGNDVQVHVSKEIETAQNWEPAGRDEDLERTILRRITGTTDRPKEVKPPQAARKAPDELLLHGEWVGQVSDRKDTTFVMIFGPRDSMELLRQDGQKLEGTYSVDWTKTPYHLDGKWNDHDRAWRTIMEFSKKDQLRIETGVSGNAGSPRPEVFSSLAPVLTKIKRFPAGSPEAHAQAAKDFETAELHRREGRYGSAYFWYELLARRHPNSSYYGQALTRLVELKHLQIRRQDGSEGWPEPSSVPAGPPPAPPQVATVPSAADYAAAQEISRLREQVKSLERRLQALEAKPGSAPESRAKPCKRVGQIIVVGNRRIPSTIFLKSLALFPGQALDDQAVKTAKKNLAALNATLELVENGDSADFQDIVVTVTEK